MNCAVVIDVYTVGCISVCVCVCVCEGGGQACPPHYSVLHWMMGNNGYWPTHINAKYLLNHILILN
jgi:hypothetical protein